MAEVTPGFDIPFLTACIRSACVLEATSRKPGNVHPQARFKDLEYADFVRSANAAAPILAKAGVVGVGLTIERAIDATRRVAPSNTNLGLVLLIAPLAAVPFKKERLKSGISTVLAALTVDDARAVYRAIRMAHPGGMGTVAAEDLSQEPTQTLLDVMKLAKDRDMIASQYANRFFHVLDRNLLRLVDDWEHEGWEQAIIKLQIDLLVQYQDSLIVRKLGWKAAEQVRLRAVETANGLAQEENASRWLPDNTYLQAFDAFLREDGNRRNPGTTADLIGATLFAAFRDRLLPLPPLDTIIA